jgi:hypothetical protein
MANMFSSGKFAIAQCDRCGWRYKLSQLRELVIKTKNVNILVCPDCWEPDQSNFYTFVYFRLRRIQDAGEGGTYTQDIPYRFLPCMVAGLAFYLSQKIPEAMDRVQFLKAEYEQAFQLAADEDREKAPIRLAPRMQFIR